MTVEITRQDGTTERVEVSRVQFVKQCEHCGEEFLTCDPDRRYPDRSHKARAYEIRRDSKN